MFCPECKSEYRTGFIRCHECDVALVDHLEEPPVENPEDHVPDYVPISTAQGMFEEGQIRSFLEANNIPTQVYGEAIRRTHGFTIDGLGLARILVPRDLADTARDLLEKANRGELEIEEPSE